MTELNFEQLNFDSIYTKYKGNQVIIILTNGETLSEILKILKTVWRE